MRLKTVSPRAGSAFGVGTFSHWDMVPGDPLEAGGGTKTRLGEPVPVYGLEREIVQKTRRRRGMSEGIGWG